MNLIREGGYVPSDDEVRSARPSLRIVEVDSRTVLLESRLVALGFQHEQAVRASKAFAQRLRDLTFILAGQQPGDEALKTCDPLTRAMFDETLRLAPAEVNDILFEMRKIGEGLRSELSQDLVEELKFNNFLKASGEDEPALTFQGAKAPVLWEMMYEFEGADPSEIDWDRFWGFRVPTTHWLHYNRTEEIPLRHGFFSAVTEDLQFAGYEADQLDQRLRRRGSALPHATLATAVRERLREEVLAAHDGDHASADVWWERFSVQRTDWLSAFLDQFQAHNRAGWKQHVLVKIFNDVRFQHDVLHFACHCEPSETEFLTRLDVRVAGEVLTFDVSLMATHLRREPKSAHDPGPLVFLNACGSGGTNDAYEPPGFPDKWIRKRGALAVVATLCPVPDYFAQAFALKFYEYLLGPDSEVSPGRYRYVAEALLATRKYFMQRFNNPLGLAYVLYATKDAHVVSDTW